MQTGLARKNATMPHLFHHFVENARPWRKVCPGRTYFPVFRRIMKLHSTPTQQYQTVTAYDESGVEINAVRFNHSLLVLPESPPVAWPVTAFQSLTAAHFEQIDAAKPDVVILGTGARQRFIHPSLIAALTARRIGVESMDSQAACRTYNILMAEGRKVALALIIEAPAA
jgi:uncharacterized protein